MGRVLALSSQVVRGHVGLSAIVPALQRLGHEVLSMPTIVLSNHPGHTRATGTRIEVNTLQSMLEVLDANGWLADIDAVMTGYLPTPEHVYFATRAIDLIRALCPKVLVLVDPVLGDDPRGLYIDAQAAAAMRAELVTRASIITPNRFELSWLSGHDVRTIDDAAVAAAKLNIAGLQVLGTSVPDGAEMIANVLTGEHASMACPVKRLAKVPHGTGDLLTGLYVGHTLNGAPSNVALGKAVAGVQQAIANSHGRSDLLLAVSAAPADWALAPALTTEKRAR
jgi:pyridoxine kinase